MQDTTEKEKIIRKVTNPETKEIYNCTDIVNQLYKRYTHDSESFNNDTKLLNLCMEWDDTIDKQFIKLKDIFDEQGFSPSFKNQLDKLSIRANQEEKGYISIDNRYVELYESQQNEKGISFLCSELDKRTGGIYPGTICTIAGGPGCMKTTTAVNIAYQAVKDGKNVCYLTLEESPVQLFSKLLSRVSIDVGTKISVSDIIKHNLSDDDKKYLFDKVLNYLKGLSGSFHMIGENDLVSYEFVELEKCLRTIDKDIKSKSDSEHGIDLIVVDHIQLLKYASSVKDEYRVMNDYVSFFRKQCLSFLGEKREISIILLSQVNREGITYAGKKHKEKDAGNYLMQHIAEASEVERASSYIVTVYTDPGSQLTKLLKIGAIKLRNASLPLDATNVFADGEYYQVGEAAPEQAEYSLDDLGLSSSLTETTSTGPSLDDVLGGLF